MNHRVLVRSAAAVAAALLAPALAGAQSTPAELRTEWGAPDLRGVWNNSTLTPFQRPPISATASFLTEEGGGRHRAAQRGSHRALAAAGVGTWPTRTAASTAASTVRPGPTDNF